MKIILEIPNNTLGLVVSAHLLEDGHDFYEKKSYSMEAIQCIKVLELKIEDEAEKFVSACEQSASESGMSFIEQQIALGRPDYRRI